jgi:hypothetical protein
MQEISMEAQTTPMLPNTQHGASSVHLPSQSGHGSPIPQTAGFSNFGNTNEHTSQHVDDAMMLFSAQNPGSHRDLFGAVDQAETDIVDS